MSFFIIQRFLLENNNVLIKNLHVAVYITYFK